MVAIREEGLIPIVEGSMVVIVGRRGCHMNYVAQRLLERLKAYPTMYEVRDYKTLVAPLFLAIFIGGKLVGGLDQLIAIHVTGKLIPMLKEAGAIWL
ncbi:P-loop containing nucleoside triphosphate hydrolase protein [Dioscorea alata]|uniref:P-loop containing nucleoside triphosphate hydrolase protein n=1 Tax=Dioscorea alata TaxID=55571 RepID=A0ACB7UXT6_DIOAL|nr:P-loop containing nucleoside triphosphate hydrolase protein [Dioscorea alata]